MKSLLVLWGVAAFLNGCATNTDHAARNDGEANGTLVVFSAYAVNADFNRRDPERPEYSNYTIYTADGQWLQSVRNSSAGTLQEPQPVSLPAGKYHIVARVNGQGLALIPVDIGSHQKTILHLDGQAVPAGTKTEAVRLPNGNIAGWKTE